MDIRDKYNLRGIRKSSESFRLKQSPQRYQSNVIEQNLSRKPLALSLSPNKTLLCQNSPDQRKKSQKQFTTQQRSKGDQSKMKKTLTESSYFNKTQQDSWKNSRMQTILIKQKISDFLNDQNLKKYQHYQQFLFHVDKGNNSELVKFILRKRPWLIETTQTSSVHFRWKPTSKDFNFQEDRLTVINHLEFHRELTTKSRLFFNIKNYCTKNKIDYNSFLPLTIILNLDDSNIQNEIKDFLSLFRKEQLAGISKNLWILKPPDLNRGQGIQIFNQIETFIMALQNCYQSKQKGQNSTINRSIAFYYHPDGQQQLDIFQTQRVINQNRDKKSRQIVLQKYLENPLLFGGRKFDFRIWVLVDQNLQYYMFKLQNEQLIIILNREGYLRLASEQFDLSQQSTNNLFIHLTNNAIQKNHSKYEKYELGNQLSFDDLQSYFDQKGHEIDVRKQIVRRMKQLITMSMQAVQDKFTFSYKQQQFEIFGYDFMIDQSGQLWLIEINTNPCIELSSPLLEKLIPRMLNDAFRLTLDKLCNPNNNGPILYDFLRDFTIPGYADDDNLWLRELLSKIV